MQQIGNELRGQAIDPLDAELRSRILATVREITPESVPLRRLRRPALVWGAAAAALFLVAILVPNYVSTSGRYSKSVAQDSRSGSSAEETERSAAESPAAAKTASSPPVANAAGSSASSAPGDREQKQRSKQRVSAGVRTPTAVASIDGNIVQDTLPKNRAFSMDGAGIVSKNALARVDPQKKKAPAATQNFAYDSDGKNLGVTGSFGGASPLLPQTHGSAVASPVHGSVQRVQRSRSAQQPVALARAGFDLNGYGLVTQKGQRISVPFNKSLSALRFGRATDGKMAFVEAAPSPVLYLRPTDTLQNDAVPGSRWQPLPPNATPPHPLSIYPAPNWDLFVAMRWYPNMTVVGGAATSARNGSDFVWLPGSRIQIGDALLPTYDAYAAYADAHPDALRLHAVANHAPKPVSPPAVLKSSVTPKSGVNKPRP